MGFDPNGIDDFIKQLYDLGDNAYDIAKKCINTASPIMEARLGDAVSKHSSKGYATGELAQSIEATRAKENAYGVFSAVRPTGTDSKGVRNMEKLAVLHYGRSAREGKKGKRAVTGQVATGVVTAAVNAAEAPVLAAMQEEFNRQVEK